MELKGKVLKNKINILSRFRREKYGSLQAKNFW